MLVGLPSEHRLEEVGGQMALLAVDALRQCLCRPRFLQGAQGERDGGRPTLCSRAEQLERRIGKDYAAVLRERSYIAGVEFELVGSYSSRSPAMR